MFTVVSFEMLSEEKRVESGSAGSAIDYAPSHSLL